MSKEMREQINNEPIETTADKLLDLFAVGGSVCYGCKFDRKCNLQDRGRYKEICSHFEQTDR